MSPLYVADTGQWRSVNGPSGPYTPVGDRGPASPETTYAHYGQATVAWQAVHTGTAGAMTISAPGVYTDRDYACDVTVSAAAATAANPIVLRASRFRGRPDRDTSVFAFLLRVLNIVEVGAVIVETSLFDPDVKYDQIEAVRCGGKVILRDSLIQNVVDGTTLLFGQNQVIRNRIRQGLQLPTTTQPDGKTHDDGVVLGGGGADLVQDNVIDGFSNAAIYARVTAPQTYGQITNAVVDHNTVSAGSATGAAIHVFKAAADPAVTIDITNNIVTPSTNEIYVGSTVTATITGNVHPDLTAAKVTRPNQ